jgi:hypothetical protein
MENWISLLSSAFQEQRALLESIVDSQQASGDMVREMAARQAEWLKAELNEQHARTEALRDDISARMQKLFETFDHLSEALPHEISGREQDATSAADSQEIPSEQLREQFEAIQKQYGELQQIVEKFDQREQALLSEKEALVRRCQELEQAVGQPREGSADASLQEELRATSEERDRLRENLQTNEQKMTGLVCRLSELEEELEKVKNTSAPDEGGESSDSDSDAKKYEMIIEDFRELQAENERLSQELQTAKSQPSTASSGPSAPVDDGPVDWETQKKRLLEALENEGEEGSGPPSEAQKQHRLKIEDVIRKTDAAIADRDKELEEMKVILENQRQAAGGAVGAAAMAEILQNDDIIREERERLQQIQEEWKQKMSQAEVEISLERAKLAREKAEIEEKLRKLEKQGGQAHTGETKAPSEGGEASGGKGGGGRWLSRLGLKGGDDE